MNIITASNSQTFHCLLELAKSVLKFYDKRLIVYDLGLTDEQKLCLDAVIKPLPEPEIVRSLSTKSNGQFRGAYKPFIVRAYFNETAEPVILIDADCMFAAKVEENGFDVGVTYEFGKKTIRTYDNGVINSGVVFFNSPCDELVDAWIATFKNRDIGDQKALSDILSQQIDWKNGKRLQKWNDLTVRIFDIHEYNDYHITHRSKIVHFVKAKHRIDIYPALVEAYKNGENVHDLFSRLERGKKPRLTRIWSKLVACLAVFSR